MFLVSKPGKGFWTGSNWDKDISQAAMVSEGVLQVLSFLYGKIEYSRVETIVIRDTHTN